MRREILWASLIGITFGLIIAFGAWRINSSLNPKKDNPVPSTTPVPTSEFRITLDKPENEDVVTSDTLTISGITKAGALLIISGEEEDSILQVEGNGSFSQEIELDPGVNQIRLTAFDPNGAASIEKVLVVYSSAFPEKSIATPEPNENTTSDSAIRQKVNQKVQGVLNKPKAYLGVVTDIADSTIQIKTTNGEIRQVSTSKEDITVINSKGTTNKNVKLTDIAIGDFIIAMGYRNGNAVLSAERILVTNPITDSTVDVKYAKVIETANKTIDVEPGANEIETLTPTAGTDLISYLENEAEDIKLAGLDPNDLVIYVTTSTDSKTSLRSLFLIKKADGQ